MPIRIKRSLVSLLLTIAFFSTVLADEAWVIDSQVEWQQNTGAQTGLDIKVGIASPTKTEGNFHIIFENWDPINASQRSWDSPLAGHAISPDGVNDFKIVAPAVDERTKPTGEIKTYTHPHWAKEDPKNYPTNVAEYEVHEPNQEAFGDWAAISIGGQYYLFGDYDHQLYLLKLRSEAPQCWCREISGAVH